MTSQRVNFQHAVFEPTASESWAIKGRTPLNLFSSYMYYSRKWIVHVMGPFRNLTNTKGECALPVKGSKTVSRAPVHRPTCWAVINISLFKVSRPLTYWSLPLLPPEGLCFPRGPRSGFHHRANKAACISPRASAQCGNMTPCPSDEATFLTSKGNMGFVYRGWVCVQNCLGNKGEENERKTHNFPVCGISVSVLELIQNAHPAKFGVSWGRGLPVDQDIVI